VQCYTNAIYYTQQNFLISAAMANLPISLLDFSAPYHAHKQRLRTNIGQRINIFFYFFKLNEQFRNTANFKEVRVLGFR
jgi:hypothetical protein